MKVGGGKCEKDGDAAFVTESVGDAVQQSACPACCSPLTSWWKSINLTAGPVLLLSTSKYKNKTLLASVKAGASLQSSIKNFLMSFKSTVWARCKALVCCCVVYPGSSTGRCSSFLKGVEHSWRIMSALHGRWQQGKREHSAPHSGAQHLAESSP